MSTLEIVENVLTHFGKKGMKWGVRSSSGQTAVSVRSKGKKLKTSGGKGFPAHADAVRARTAGQIVKKSGTKALSNDDLKAYSRRLQLETSVSQLSRSNKGSGAKFANIVVNKVGNKVVDEVLNATSASVKKTIKRAIN